MLIMWYHSFSRGKCNNVIWKGSVTTSLTDDHLNSCATIIILHILCGRNVVLSDHLSLIFYLPLYMHAGTSEFEFHCPTFFFKLEKDNKLSLLE